MTYLLVIVAAAGLTCVWLAIRPRREPSLESRLIAAAITRTTTEG